MKFLLPAAIAAACAAPVSSQAAFTLLFENTGSVGPADPMTCPDPFAGCALKAVGVATAVSGTLSPLPGPWDFESVFRLTGELAPFLYGTEGTFLFDDPTAANNDLFGVVTGAFNLLTVQNQSVYAATGGSGIFAGGAFGSSTIQVNRTLDGHAEQGSLTVPVPGTAALAALTLLASLRRAPRGSSRNHHQAAG